MLMFMFFEGGKLFVLLSSRVLIWVLLGGFWACALNLFCIVLYCFYFELVTRGCVFKEYQIYILIFFLHTKIQVSTSLSPTLKFNEKSHLERTFVFHSLIYIYIFFSRFV